MQIYILIIVKLYDKSILGITRTGSRLSVEQVGDVDVLSLLSCGCCRKGG